MDLKSILSGRILCKHLILTVLKNIWLPFLKEKFILCGEENVLTLYYHFLFNFIVLLQVLLLLFLPVDLVIAF